MENLIGFNEVKHCYMGEIVTDLVIGNAAAILSYCKDLLEPSVIPLYMVNSFDRFETIHYRKIIIVNS